jgi:hypothetical protein
LLVDDALSDVFDDPFEELLLDELVLLALLVDRLSVT